MYQNLRSKILKLLFLNSLILLGQALVFHNPLGNHLQMWIGLLQILISLNTVGFPPALLETYSQQMKKMRGTTNAQPTVSEKESSMQDAEQYSGTEISSGEAARITDEVQGVMRQQFAQAPAHAEAISNLEEKDSAA